MVDPIIITLAVTAGAFILFATEVIPPDVTALAAAAALMVTDVLTPREGLSGFSSPATITVMSMFILAAGIQRAGLVNTLAHWVLDMAKGSVSKFTLLMLGVAGVVSGFINNTPVVAIMVPLVITVASQLKRSPSKFLIPLSYAAILGGTMTLIGTSTNILASDISDQLGYGTFSMFMFAKVGFPLLLVGGAFLFLVAPKLLPERHEITEVTERFKLRDYVCEIVLEPSSPLIGQTVQESDLKQRFDVDVIRVFRGETVIDQPLVGLEFQEHDVLLIRASRDELLKIRDTEGVAILPEVTHGLPGEEGETVLVEAIVAPGAFIEGATLRESGFRQRFNAVVLGVKKRERIFLRRIQNLRLEHGDTLLLSGERATIDALKRNPDFIIAEELEITKFRRRKIPIVLAILIGVVGTAAMGIFDISVAALTGVVLLVLTGSLRVNELHESIRWDIVFLLAGVIPLGIALEQTGAAALMAEFIVQYAGGFPPVAILSIFFALTLILTQIISNNASVALMLPIAVDLAEVLGLNVITFILACTFAASMGFLSPIGYQTNLMVYGPGEYKFTDFMKVGLPLSIIVGTLCVWLLTIYWPLAA